MRSEIAGGIRRWLEERANGASFSDEDNYILAGVLDSFGVIELIEFVENEFHVRFTEKNFQDRRFTSVSGLSQIVSESLGD